MTIEKVNQALNVGLVNDLLMASLLLLKDSPTTYHQNPEKQEFNGKISHLHRQPGSPLRDLQRITEHTNGFILTRTK